MNAVDPYAKYPKATDADDMLQQLMAMPPAVFNANVCDQSCTQARMCQKDLRFYAVVDCVGTLHSPLSFAVRLNHRVLLAFVLYLRRRYRVFECDFSAARYPQSVVISWGDLRLIELLVAHGMVFSSEHINTAGYWGNPLILDAVARTQPYISYNPSLNNNTVRELLVLDLFTDPRLWITDDGSDDIYFWQYTKADLAQPDSIPQRHLRLWAFNEAYCVNWLNRWRLFDSVAIFVKLAPKLAEIRCVAIAEFTTACWTSNRLAVADVLCALATLDWPALVQYEICAQVFPRLVHYVSMHRFWQTIVCIRHFLADEQKQERLFGVVRTRVVCQNEVKMVVL